MDQCETSDTKKLTNIKFAVGKANPIPAYLIMLILEPANTLQKIVLRGKISH
jgi:hypothetical protein